MRLPIVSLVACSLIFSNCTTIDAYTGEQKTSNAALGTGIGAAGGAILGAIIGNNTGDGDGTRGALIGAGIGAAAGGGIGVYMDQQEAQIRQQLQGSGVSVSRSGNNIVLNMPENITFEVGQDYLKDQFYKTSITVNGHTDSDGGTSFNQGLSERRASSVANYLGSKGVAGNRLQPIGYGESSPIASNSSAAGKAQNRRVELHIVPVQSQF